MLLPVKGTITRISGPLVIASGMQGAQMFEMVRVGRDKLIGEITRIRGDKAYIQVYESTTGLKPGEPVEGTGAPLSVELGPGLLGTIYDGVQRPLPLIAETISAERPHRRMFIERGISVDPIPKDKKWAFKPMGKALEKGSKVSGGDVIGEVEETSLITHRVMIPPGVRGTLKWVAPEGEYTVTDVIAEVEHDGRKYEVTMRQRWPVRLPRPYKVKLEPTEPLVTGTRIIDTLFPMAKGGTGAVPGGFGTGKCVLPHTPILLADGRIMAIEDFYREYKDRGVLVESSDDEELIDVSHLNLRVLSFNGREIVESRVSHIYKGRSNAIVNIRTRSGRSIQVTPIHKLLRLNSIGGIEEVEARKLKPGDKLVIPRILPIPGVPQELDPYTLGLDDAIVTDEEVLREVRNTLKALAEKMGGYDRIAETIKVESEMLRSIVVREGKPSLGIIKAIYRLAGLKPPVPEYIGLPERSERVKLPTIVDEDLAELLGLVLAGGIVTADAVELQSTSEILRARFRELMVKVFGIMPVERKSRGLVVAEARSKLVSMILEALGMPIMETDTGGVPDVIHKSPLSVIAAFIRGYYMAGGSSGEGSVEIPASSRKLASGLSYLLSRLGILYTVVEDRVGSGTRYRIRVVDGDDVERFHNMINNRATGALKTVNAVKLARSYGGNKGLVGQLDREVPVNYMASMNAGIALISTLKDEDGMAESTSYITVDEVVETSLVEGDFTVYDITVPGPHNFVGGELPSILHNTVTLHSLAQWSAARVVVYIGCGERGNEMTEVLERFPKYKDPWTGKPLMDRTILIANTSNMPVAAREASIYVGVTLAEYYRDMGYDVLLVADSTSRWAEALREIAGRLEEMPAEEGYPSYLASRLAEFYERAGRVETLGQPDRTGSVTIVGAVSPPGGDFTEPVTSHTKRFVRVFWALDTKLAYSRHYPAINWLLSYSAYVDLVSSWWHENVDPRWKEVRDEAMDILIREDELQEIVRLVGTESLDEKDKLVLETARLIKDGFLRQNAFDPIDAFSTPEKQFKLLKMIIDYHHKALELVEHGIPVAKIREAIGRLYVDMVKAKFTIPNDQLEKIEELRNNVIKALESLEVRSG